MSARISQKDKHNFRKTQAPKQEVERWRQSRTVLESLSRNGKEKRLLQRRGRMPEKTNGLSLKNIERILYCREGK